MHCPPDHITVAFGFQAEEVFPGFFLVGDVRKSLDKGVGSSSPYIADFTSRKFGKVFPGTVFILKVQE